jgi:hypothetical protein
MLRSANIGLHDGLSTDFDDIESFQLSDRYTTMKTRRMGSVPPISRPASFSAPACLFLTPLRWQRRRLPRKLGIPGSRCARRWRRRVDLRDRLGHPTALCACRRPCTRATLLMTGCLHEDGLPIRRTAGGG